MTKPLVNFADPERAIVDYLTAALTETVGTFYPSSSADAPVVPFVQVAWDGTPTVDYPVTQRASVRITTWESNPTASKALLAKVQGLMATHPGDANVYAVTPLTGGLPARDPGTSYYLCSGTFRVSVRPLTAA